MNLTRVKGYVSAMLQSLLLLMLAAALPQAALATGDWAQQRIAYVAFEGRQLHLVVMDAYDGGNKHVLEGLPSGSIKPVWSPNGQAIAFNAKGLGGRSDIFQMKYKDGGSLSDMANVTNSDMTDDMYVDYMRDGSAIAYSRLHDDGNNDIFLDRFAGDDLRLTVEPQNNTAPSLSPDGQRVAYSSTRDSNGEIYTVDTKGDFDEKPLTNDPSFDGAPAWSPASPLIAFESDRDGDSEIYIQAVGPIGEPRGPAMKLTDNDVDDIDPAWSPDGLDIVFVSDRDGDGEIYRMSLPGGEGENGANLKQLTFNGTRDRTPTWGVVPLQEGGQPPPPPSPPPPPGPPDRPKDPGGTSSGCPGLAALQKRIKALKKRAKADRRRARKAHGQRAKGRYLKRARQSQKKAHKLSKRLASCRLAAAQFRFNRP